LPGSGGQYGEPVPVGYLILILLIAGFALLQLIPVPRNPLVRVASFWTSMVVNEQPHWFAMLLLASTGLAIASGDIDSPAGWLLVGAAAIAVIGLIAIAWRMFPARGALRGAISDLDPAALQNLEGRGPGLAALAAPFGFGRRRVEFTAGIPYGPAGERNLLDVYRPRKGPVTGPTLIYLHGGGFKGGSRKREGQLALYRLAARGWACVSASYRVSPDAQFPDYPIDLKRVIAWAREDGARFGVDPDRIFLAGSSAGGHIAATVALTANEPLLQPGFESVDTSVAGTIGLYGYYGGLEYGSLRPRGPLPSSPRDLIRPGAPPFLIVHGDRDTIVSVGIARSFVKRLREAGIEAAYAELPGAQHTFDLLRSVRNQNVTDAIEDFAAWVLSDRSVTGSD
jgi:acetyl esterase/lipase